MTALSDVDLLRRRIDTLTRAASRIRQHARDLHTLGYDQAVTGIEKVAGGQPDWAPKSGDPRARRLFERIVMQVASIEAELVGLDRTMMVLFNARAERPEPTRGSTISVAEHDRLLAKQKQSRDGGQYVPARIEAQPQHPGKRR